MTDRLALPRRYREQLEALLREQVPGVEVWAYGSRVNGRSHEGSDLDLVLRGPALEPLDGDFYDLLEAIEKSNIPILVQAHDWAMLSESFHREIERAYVVVQKGVKQTQPGVWREVALSEIGKIVTGKTPSSRNPGYFGGAIPFVTPSDFNGRRRIESTERHLTEKGLNTVKGTRIPSNSVMVSCIGSDMGKAAIAVEPCVTNQQINSIVVDSDSEPLFVYYNLSNRKEEIRASASGSAQPILNKSGFGRLRILLPPLPEQRTIAHVLGTLDDKIELNRQTNETLEEMARALFKSWFVDFEPVRAKMEGRWRRGESLPGLPADLYDLFPDRLVDSELGEIPEGWEVKTLGSFGEIVTGKTPSTREPAYFGDDVPFLRIPDMHRNMYVLQTDMMLSTLGADSQPGKTLPPGSVSVSCIATPGLVVLNHRHTQTNQQINTIVPRNQPISRYLYWVCSHLSKDIETGGLGGSVLGNMNKSSFSALLVLNPEAAVLRAFDELASPLHTMILATEEQNQTLTQERDTLLPRLVSGEVRVGTE